MLSLTESVSLIVAIVIASIACLWLLHRIWSTEERRKNNDLVGWQITVIGTTYAVIIGFMLYAVWNNYQEADANVEAEADALVNTARAAQGLATPQRLEIQSLALDYVNSVLTQEWPAMTANQVSPLAVPIVEELWKRSTNAETHSTSQQTSLNHLLNELSTMTQHRRLRLSQAQSGIPSILWTVLIVGAIFTILSACLFGSVDFRLHFIQVFMLSLLVALILAAISDISRPFQGYVHVSPAGFHRARVTLENMNQQGH
ncbi:MAG TPA: DUF4239 domain-containing protein [Bryobacteraceae bacterium]|nr:DUF4239 domain-containing protein [Bryobacteraceae bacterium]